MGEAKLRKRTMDAAFDTAPLYKCHKVVRALKITAYHAGPGILEFGPGYPKTMPPKQLFARYAPVPGDYVVFYEDGYVSISPAKEFEDGYELLA